MPYQRLPGRGFYWPEPLPQWLLGPTLASTALLDATGEKVAHLGRVWTPDGGTKLLRTVGFPFGTVVKAGGSGLTVSLQDVSLTSGTPLIPDGTPDQTVAIATGDASFVTDAWYQTGNLSADRSVAPGDLLAVVIEFNGSGRLGADSVIVKSPTLNFAHLQDGVAHYTGTWANLVHAANVVLGFSDGTFGALEGSSPCTLFGQQNFNSGSNPAEYALEFSFPFNCKIDGMWACVVLSVNNKDFEVVLYNGTTAMTGGTIAVDANAVTNTGVRVFYAPFSQELTLAANTTYRLAFKPTTANGMGLIYLDVANAAHFQGHSGGAAWCWGNRASGGSWNSPTTTRRPLAGVRVSSIDLPTGGPRIGGGWLR
jgi:hypothetical protein